MPDPGTNNEPEQTVPPLTLAAATFLVQALELSDDPATIAAEFETIKEDPHASIHSVQLESSIGPTAFLVYVYAFLETDDEGHSGRDLYESGRETLVQAADRDTPGPRMVAHADTEAFGFILATTPATWRALMGEAPAPSEATPADLPQTSVSAEERASLAEDLHRSIREANANAEKWLASIQDSGTTPSADDLDFSEEETALALHVMDDANIRPLLTSLNLLITSAQKQAARLTQEPETDS